MDADRFDNLARALGAALPRQRVVRLLAGFGAVGLAALSRFGDIVSGSDADALAAKKKRRKKKKRQRKRRRLCPGKQDKVCHCPPGNTDNCETTGNGKAHRSHELDCCCTIKGRPNPLCSCSGNECCKRAGPCTNTSQCCDGMTCTDGRCQQPGGCEPLTCADFLGQCGRQDDGCGGQTADCLCPNPTDDCVDGVCVAPNCEPLTCADVPDQCGSFADGCDGEIDCACPGGGCCDGVCTGDGECCQANDCPRQLCQVRACDDGTCAYTPVEDGQPGPLCAGQGRLCCDGECLSDGQCCTVQDCQEQACQTVDCIGNECVSTPVPDGGQGPLCSGDGDFCCNGNECCSSGETCFEFGCCSPQTPDEACAGSNVACGIVSDGCGGEIDCGDCQTGQNCMAGACVAPRSGKRCKGKGLAGQPCRGKRKNGKKCKCRGGRRCHNKTCCESKGDGSRHCNANSDCCPGLTCARKNGNQHKVCLRRGGANSAGIMSSPIRTDDAQRE